jgi:hypothetical protein
MMLVSNRLGGMRGSDPWLVRSHRAPTFDFRGGTLPSGAALTRASTGWYFDSSQALAAALTDVARFTYDTAGGGLRGLLNEPAETNGIRNSGGAGSTPGTPGTQPTNWVLSSTANNVTRTIVGSGTEDGIGYCEVRFAGTPSATATLGLAFEATNQIAAVANQTWTASMFVSLTAGSLANLSGINLALIERDSGGASLGTVVGTTITSGFPALLRQGRISTTKVLPAVGLAFVQPQLRLTHTNGLAVDFTIRMGQVQCALSSVLTSPIVTTAGAVTRAADIVLATVANGTYVMDVRRMTGTTRLFGQVVGAGTWAVPTDISPVRSILARRTA